MVEFKRLSKFQPPGLPFSVDPNNQLNLRCKSLEGTLYDINCISCTITSGKNCTFAGCGFQ